MNVEIPVDDIREHVVRLVSIGVYGEPVVRGRAVKFRIEQALVALAVVEGSGHERLQAVVKALAKTHSALVGVPASGPGGKFRGVQVASSLGDHVDDRSERSRAVNGGIGPANDLDPFDEIHVDRELRPHISSVKEDRKS